MLLLDPQADADAFTGRKNPANLIVSNIAVFFRLAEHYNSSTATSYRAHSLGLNTHKNNTDATFGIFQSS